MARAAGWESDTEKPGRPPVTEEVSRLNPDYPQAGTRAAVQDLSRVKSDYPQAGICAAAQDRRRAKAPRPGFLQSGRRSALHGIYSFPSKISAILSQA